MNILRVDHLRRVSARIALGLTVGAFALGGVACGDDDEETPDLETKTANLRVLHLSADAPPVDVFVNEAATPTVRGLEYTAGTDYLPVLEGEYQFDIAPAGAGLAASVLSVEDVNLDEGKSYTVVAYDQVANLKALPLEDDTRAPAAGKARIRAVHVAPGVGEVDIWNVPATGAPAPLFTDVNFGDAADAIEVSSAAYRVGIDVNDDASPDLVFELPTLEAGTLANIFAVSKDGEVSLVVQTQDGVAATANPVQ